MGLPAGALEGDVRARLLGGQHDFFEAQPLGVQKHPHHTPVCLDATRSQLRCQAARGERAFGHPRPQPLGVLAHQGARLVSAHLVGRQGTGLAPALSPLRHAGRPDPQGRRNLADRLTRLGALHRALTQILGVRAHPRWPPSSSPDLESDASRFRNADCSQAQHALARAIITAHHHITGVGQLAPRGLCEARRLGRDADGSAALAGLG